MYGVPLLARLQSEGIDFVVDDPVLVRQFGERRRYNGDPIAELHVVTGMEAVDAASDPNTIALVSDVSVGDRIELQASTVAIEPWLLDGSITCPTPGSLLWTRDSVSLGSNSSGTRSSTLQR